MSNVISKSNLPMVRKTLEAAINKALSDMDPTLFAQLGNIRYNPGKDFRVKLEVKSTAALTPFGAGIKGSFNDLGRDVNVGSKFLYRGREYTVTAFKYRNHKYPVIASRRMAGTRSGVKSFKFSLETVRDSVSLNDNAESVTNAFQSGLRPR